MHFHTLKVLYVTVIVHTTGREVRVNIHSPESDKSNCQIFRCYY